MKTLISALVLLALTQPAPRPAAPPAFSRTVQPTPYLAVPPAPTSAAPVLPSLPVAPSTGVANPAYQPRAVLAVPRRGSNAPGLWEQACAKVLVVPAPGLTDENLARITEDMTVMCRILDKALAPSLTGAGPARAAVPANDLVALSGLLHSTPGSDDESQTQGLYLGGYGALFFLQVDFPLRAPAAQQTTPAQGGPTTDPTWSQTVEELQGSPAANPAAPATAVPYDEGRVENLKTALIRSLRHAANLRLTSAQDFITLVVGPRDNQAPLSYSTSNARITLRGTAQTGPDTAAGAPLEPASVLVLRVRKADADALAQGQLPADQFAEKVQLFWSRAYPGATESAAPVRSYILQRK
jgi:hypothetical protein